MRATCLAFLLAVLVLLVCPAWADSEARAGADWVRITAQPCTEHAVLQLIQDAGEDPADYRAARAEFGGVPYTACWRPRFEQRAIFLRYGDGDGGLVPFDALKPVREV